MYRCKVNVDFSVPDQTLEGNFQHSIPLVPLRKNSGYLTTHVAEISALIVKSDRSIGEGTAKDRDAIKLTMKNLLNSTSMATSMTLSDLEGRLLQSFPGGIFVQLCTP